MYNPFTAHREIAALKLVIQCERDVTQWYRDQYDQNELLDAGWKMEAKRDGKCKVICWIPPKKYRTIYKRTYYMETALQIHRTA